LGTPRPHSLLANLPNRTRRTYANGIRIARHGVFLADPTWQTRRRIVTVVGKSHSLSRLTSDVGTLGRSRGRSESRPASLAIVVPLSLEAVLWTRLTRSTVSIRLLTCTTLIARVDSTRTILAAGAIAAGPIRRTIRRQAGFAYCPAPVDAKVVTEIRRLARRACQTIAVFVSVAASRTSSTRPR